MNGTRQPTRLERWPRRRIADLFDIQLGKMLSQRARAGNSPFPYVRNADVQWGRVNTSSLPSMDFDAREAAKFELIPGDVLVCEGGEPGRAAVWLGATERCYYQKAIHRLRRRTDEILSEFYVAWARVAFRRNGEHDFRGAKTTIAHLPAIKLAELTMPVPPLKEQHAIIVILRNVQRGMDVETAIVATLKELKAATMAKVFGAHSWTELPLGSIAKVGNGSTPNRNDPRYWVEGSIPWLTSAKVHEKIIESADEFVTEVAKQECHLPSVPPSSVVVAITGQGKTLGNAALVTIETCINQHLAYITLNSDRVLPHYLLAFLQSRYDDLRAVAQAGGTTKGALTCGYLKTLAIPVPPLDEQRVVISTFRALRQAAIAADSRRRLLEELFDAALNSLMSGDLAVDSEAAAGQ